MCNAPLHGPHHVQSGATQVPVREPSPPPIQYSSVKRPKGKDFADDVVDQRRRPLSRGALHPIDFAFGGGEQCGALEGSTREYFRRRLRTRRVLERSSVGDDPTCFVDARRPSAVGVAFGTSEKILNLLLIVVEQCQDWLQLCVQFSRTVRGHREGNGRSRDAMEPEPAENFP